MPFPDLNLGRTVSSAPGAGAPAGENQSPLVSGLPQTQTPDPSADALKAYYASPTSLAQQELDESVGSKIANFFIGASTQPGEMNVVEKLRLAKAQHYLEMSKHDLAVKNSIKHQQQLELAAKEHNQNMQLKAYEALPNAKGLLDSIADPEQRKVEAVKQAKIFNSMAPGVGDMLLAMGESRAWVLGVDELASSNSAAGEAFRDLSKTMGYEKAALHPATKAMILTQSKDLIPLVYTRFTQAQKEKLSKEGMTEAEFREAFKESASDPSFKPTARFIAYAMSTLDESFAAPILAHLGVKLDSTALKMQQKEKPAGEETLSGIKAKEYNKLKARVALAEQDPEAFAPAQVADMKKQMGILLGTESKDQGSNPNNMVNQRLQIISKGKVQDVESIAAMPPGKSKDQAYVWAEQARHEQDRASAQSASNVRMSEPHDMNAQPVYKLDKTGNPVKVTTPMTKGEYLSGRHGFTMTAEQKEKLGMIDYAENEGLAILDLADNAYKATSTASRGAETISESTLNNPLTAWTLTDTHPDMKLYLDERKSLLGKFSKGLGGETGVLTNQDIERVIAMFPSAADTPNIRQLKREAFKRIIALNKRAITKLIAGNQGTEFEGTVTPEQLSVFKKSTAVRAEIEGTIGAMEGLRKQNAPREATSLASDEKKPEASLFGQMRKKWQSTP